MSMSICNICERTTHSYVGKCTACGKRKVEEWERHISFEYAQRHDQRSLSDDNLKEVAGLLFMVLLFMLLAGGIAILVATWG